MKTLLFLVTSVALSTNAFATMEASWDETALNSSSAKISCPTYIYIKDQNNQLSQKVWAHEVIHHKGSVVDSGECVYQ